MPNIIRHPIRIDLFIENIYKKFGGIRILHNHKIIGMIICFIRIL